jgi:hypothetical protein
MESFLAAIEGTAAAQYLRDARWGYAAVNGVHIVGIALLVGSVVPLNLRFLGFWPTIPRADLIRVLVPLAIAGLALAALTGPLLFSIKAQDYADIGFFRVKLALIGIAILSAVTLHWHDGFLLEGASRRRLRFHAILSLGCWLGALACGRLIAFAD